GDLGDPPPPRERYPHIVRQQGDPIAPAQHSFDFEGKSYTISVDVDPQLYWGAVATENGVTTDASETHDELLTANYRYLVQDPLQAPLIASTCDSLRAAAKSAGLGRDRYVEFVAKYVQSMPYDYARLADKDAKTRFPVETLVDGTGVCGDKSLLIAALLAHEGYEVSLLAFESENHMAVGITGPGKHYGETSYLFVESTTPAYVGEIPEHFVSGVTLTSEPLVIPVGTGKLQYEGAKRTARIMKVRRAAHSSAEKLRSGVEGRALTVGEANAVNAKLHTAYEAQFKLSSIKDHEDEFLDSKKAVAWIEKHCWWD
ncbi:MAG TPA: transglutaminase-like domain-containing protein, partial [Coriobacteriia bacterium]|nr:transglutaminase-like domain-containing protein [Coriobacteriia bacterium]